MCRRHFRLDQVSRTAYEDMLELTHFFRWYLYDTMTHVMFQRRLGFLDKGRDVRGLLAAFRHTTFVIGLMALFPYLLGPLVKLPVIKNLVLPRSSDKQGVGKAMKVSMAPDQFSASGNKGLSTGTGETDGKRKAWPESTPLVGAILKNKRLAR